MKVADAYDSSRVHTLQEMSSNLTHFKSVFDIISQKFNYNFNLKFLVSESKDRINPILYNRGNSGI